jgi:hypothetical protein
MADPNPESVVVPIRDAVAEAINQGAHKAAESSSPHSMTASIFISYASKDRAAAHTICDALEHRGFVCWMADRDIGPGENFQVSIVHAIRSAKAMILVFSANAANSDEIKKEVVLAGQSRLVVIPVRVEDVTPDEAFAYEMATRQWIDLFSDWEQSVQRLVRQLETVIHVKPDLKVSRGTPVVEQGPGSHKEPSSPPVSEPAAASPLPPKPVVLSPKKLDWRLIAAPGATAAVIATVLLLWLGPSFSHSRSSAPTSNLPLNQEVFGGHFDDAGSADFKPLNQEAGLFTRSCSKITLNGGDLEAACRMRDQRTFQSSITLNNIIANVDGKLTWQREGQGHFLASSQNCHLTYKPVMTLLHCNTRRMDGEWTSSCLNLDEQIDNNNGTLQYIESPKAARAKG